MVGKAARDKYIGGRRNAKCIRGEGRKKEKGGRRRRGGGEKRGEKGWWGSREVEGGLTEVVGGGFPRVQP